MPIKIEKNIPSFKEWYTPEIEISVKYSYKRNKKHSLDTIASELFTDNSPNKQNYIDFLQKCIDFLKTTIDEFSIIELEANKDLFEFSVLKSNIAIDYDSEDFERYKKNQYSHFVKSSMLHINFDEIVELGY
jgi:hypothetical protein